MMAYILRNKKMYQRIAILMIAVIILPGLLLIACDNVRQPNQEPIKLGWIGALSGTNAILGQWDTHGIELVIDEVNALGGVCGGRKLQLVKYDDAADPTKSVAFAQKLSGQDQVLLAFATTNSNTALADLPVFAKNQVPQMTQASSADLTARSSSYIFRYTSVGAVFEFTVVDYLVKKGLSKFAIISDSSTYGKGQGDYEQAALRKNSLESLTRETYNIDDTDFTQQLTRIAATNPQVLLIAGSENAAGLIARQARKLGFTGQIAGGPALGTPTFIQVAGAAAEGVIFSSPYIDNSINEQTRDFARRYQAKWGYEPEQHGVKGYDGAMIAIEAIKRSCNNLTRKEITTQLHAIKDFQGLQGVFSYQDNGEGISQAQIGIVKNGQLTVIQK
jgi:branched-chain amino acid transport system substrate-binding protein